MIAMQTMRPMQNMKKSFQKGFTLIELMIVVAIIGILAAVALPAYQDYITRAKLSKAITAVDPLKTALTEYAQNNSGAYPAAALASGGDWGIIGMSGAQTISTTEVASVAVAAATGAITITLASNLVGGATITLTPSTAALVASSSIVKWVATSSDSSAPMKKLLSSLS